MHLKLLGAGLIVFTAYCYGNYLSSIYLKRVRLLEDLILALEMFLAEVGYGLTPLPRAFQNIGSRLKSPVGRMFVETAQLMGQGKGLTAFECWEKAVGECLGDLELRENQAELFLRLGLIWGKGDKNGQLRQVALMQEMIRQALDQAQKERNKNEKMWKYLGLLGGITLVIFLF